MRISDWSSDVCPSDLRAGFQVPYYREAVDLALHASTAFADIRLQAWDIAITDSGPVPLEVNVVGSLFIPQLLKQQGLWAGDFRRSEGRRVGKACVSTCRSRRSPYHKTKQKIEKT